MADILFAGDVHGNTRHVAYLFETAQREGCDTIFQVGDFGYWPHVDDGRAFLVFVAAHVEASGIQWYWIDGNHDNHEALAEMPVSDDGLRYLTYDGGIVHVPRGAEVIVNGVRIVGYGGAYSIDKEYRVEMEHRHGVRTWWAGEMIDPAHMENVCERLWLARPDVLATHDAPAGFQLGNEYKQMFFHTEANRHLLRRLMDCAKPGRVITGHWHERRTAVLDGIRVDVLDCDQARDRRDSWLVVKGNHSEDRAPTQVPSGPFVQDAEVCLAYEPVSA
jgi:predicted phosphodiesterase